MGNMQDALKQIQSGGSYTAPASVSQKTGTQTGGMKSVLKQIESGNTPQGYANILDRYKNTTSYSSVLGRQKGPYAQAVEDNRNAKLGEKLKGITGGTLKGLGKTYAADIANAVATLGQTMGAIVENNPMAQSLARPADVLKSREQQRQDQDEALGRLQGWSDRAALAGQQDIQKAQSYTGNAGDALIEAGVGAGQSLIDMGLAATGIGGMIPLLTRVYGGATRQARQEGADLRRQNLYGVTSGALEGIIEKATGGVGKIYGAGAADDLIEALVGKTKLGNTGRNIMRGFINAQGEGLEEAISSLLSPAVDAIYKGNLRENYSEYEINEALRSYLIGAMSGGFIETLTGISGANRAANAVLDDENVQRTVENYWNTVKESNVLSKESRAALQRASEEMGTARQMMAIAKQAGVSTEAARALLEARRGRDTAEQNTAQRAAQTAERMEINENLSDAGQGNGLDGIGAGEPAGVFSEAAGEPAAIEPENQGEAGRGTENPESADLREVSPEELGITGAQNPVMLIDAERAGGRIAAAADTVRSVGMEPVAFRGELRVGNASVNGYIEDGRIFFRTDAVDSQGREITAEQIVEHELFHAAAETDPQLVEDVKEVVRERMTEAEFDGVMADYETAYSKVQDFSDWTAEKIAEYLYQEIAADAYAGLNAFAGNAVAVPGGNDIIREKTAGRNNNGRTEEENEQGTRENDPDARRQNIEVLGTDGGRDRRVPEREIRAGRDRDAGKAKRDIIKVFGTARAVRQDVEELIEQYLKKIEANGELTETEKNDLLLELIESGEVRLIGESYYSKARDRLYKQWIYVPDGVRAEFPDEYEALRRRAFGAKEFLTGNINDSRIDALAQELAETYGYAEFSDYTNPSALLRRMVDYAAEGSRRTVSLDDYLSGPASDFGPYENGLMHFDAELEDILQEYQSKQGKVGADWTENKVEMQQRIRELEQVRDDAEDADGYYAAQDEIDQLQERLAEMDKPTGRAMVAGINARNADSNSLRRAEELERDGMGNEAVRQETGWYRGMDGQWRFEIDDSGARFFRRGDSTVQGNPDYIRWDTLYGKLFDGTITDEEVDELRALESALNGVRGFGVRKNPQSGTLRDYLSHPALFEAYPGLAEVRVRFERLEDGTDGAYRPEENVIVLNGKLRNDSDGAIKTLLHEIQHAIQREEGFAKGASPKYWEERMREGYSRRWDNGWVEMMPSELYRNTAGEIEARATAARRSLTAEERKKTPPDLGDGNTVFADGESQALSAENDGNESRETITPQERELAREGIVWLNRDGKRVEVEIRRATTGQWFFSVRAVGGRPVYDETPYTTAQEAARAAMQIAEQYTIPEQTKAKKAINKAADEAIETPPPIGRFTKAERDLEEDRLRTLVEDVPWGAGSITLSQDQEAAAAAETFADERAEKQAAEDMADAMEDYRELLKGQMPVRSETADQKVTAELKVKKEPRNVRIREGWRSAVRAIVNAGDTIHRIARETGNKALDGYYFRALAARQAGTEWIAGKRHDIMGRQTGQGLNEIFNPIRAKGQDYYEQFQMYLYHQLNIDRMSRDYEKDAREAQAEVDRLLRVEPGLANLSATRLQQIANGYSLDAELAKDYLEAVGRRNAAEKKGPKPVFGFDVTADDSRAAVERLIEKHPEFAELAQSVYDYSNDLLQYRVDAGLIQQKDKDFLQRLYPHYVPTFRATAEERARILHKGGLSVSKAIGRATGSNDVLLPLHVSLARQAMTVTKNGTINRLGNALLETRDANKEAMSPYILEVKEAESGFSEDSFDEEETLEPRQENVITIIENGKRYDLTLDKGLTEAFKAFEPDAWGDMAIFQASKGMVDLFKKLVTAYNPLFVIRNALRDVQDAGLYSVDSKEWAKNFPRAYQQIKNDGKYWQMYKGLGGNYASFFDYATGEVRAENTGIVGKIEMVNRWVEAAPRLAEFMTVIQKAEARGEVTEADLMEAFEAAQDVTTNFGRAGSFGKLANKYLVPFLNPSIQGADKFIRTLTEGKSAKAWAALAVKAAALGIAPTILNALLYRDDEEWDDISDANKANNYLFKGRDGVWIKIPKGRAIATLSAGAVAAAEALRGDELDPREYLDIIATNVAPQNPMEANIFKAWFDADLFQADSKGQTWYGGTIETERMQSYRPGERYDESTDVVSKWIGDKLDLSPAKINYLIDQYSGVVGDMLLPLLTPQAERDPLSKAFTIDTVTNNEATGEYYDQMDELKWDMNSGDIAGGTTYRYMSHANSAVSEYYSKIREIEADQELTNREKKELTRELYRDLVEYQKEIMDTAEKYRLAAEDYYDEHPELDHEDPAAVKAYMEQYNAQQTTEEYYKNADQTKDLMEAIVYREVNREVLGAEYALETYSDSVYERAAEVNRSAAVSYDTYYDYYFGTKDMHADRDENGKSISGTKKAKVLGFIADMEISDEQKDALAIDAGYKAGSWKSYADGKSGGGSGGRGRSKKDKAVKVKNTLTKPVGITYNRSMSIAARTPKDTSAYEDIQKATSQLRKKNPWYELPTGNPELDEAPPAAARYFATGRF